MAHGWIKDRFYRVAPLSLTAGVEATNVIPVAIALVDQEGDAIEESRLFKAEIIDDNAELVAVTAFTISVAVGTAVTTDVRPAVVLSLTSAGLATLNITDVVGASGATVHVLLTPLGLRGAPVLTTLTFD